MSLKTLLRCAATVLLVVSLAPSMACMGKVQQAAQRAQTSNDLKQIWLVYMNYQDSNGRGPATLKEFADFAQTSDPSAMPVVNSLQSGKYVIYLGVKITDLKEGSSNTVLAYEAGVPTSGGLVVMADGFVKTMTAGEFAAAPKPPNPKPSQP
jgi:hypothetical protein